MINDRIIDFYTRFIFERYCHDCDYTNDSSDIFVFSTHFFSKLYRYQRLDCAVYTAPSC